MKLAVKTDMQHPKAGGDTATGPALRLLIASTPKTGNTWLKHMLAALYELPIVDLPIGTHPGSLSALPTRWIAHQHLAPTQGLLDLVHSGAITVLTSLRQPADILISLFHHVQNYAGDSGLGAERVMCLDPGRPGRHTAAYVRNSFYGLLHVSAAWLGVPRVHAVRYEDLRRDTPGELARLTEALSPVRPEYIQRIAEEHGLDRMRQSQGDEEGRFYRQGRVGDGLSSLPSFILRELANAPPYPELHAILGYPVPQPFVHAAGEHRFAPGDCFDTGVPVPALAECAYDSAPPDLRATWNDLRATGPGTFYDWLNAPLGPQDALPVLTHLALAGYMGRDDLRERWADPLTADRASVALWWTMRAAVEFGVDSVFVHRIRNSLLDWGCDVSPADPSPHPLPVTRLVEAVYRMRSDVRAGFADLFGVDRIAVLNWFVQYGCSEHGLDPRCALPIIRALHSARGG